MFIGIVFPKRLQLLLELRDTYAGAWAGRCRRACVGRSADRWTRAKRIGPGIDALDQPRYRCELTRQLVALLTILIEFGLRPGEFILRRIEPGRIIVFTRQISDIPCLELRDTLFRTIELLGIVAQLLVNE